VSRSEQDFRRVATLICIGVFVSTIATEKQLLKIPIRSFIKNQLHLEPVAMANFFFIVAFAWYLKPLAGILSDSVPLFGLRRRSYLLFSTFLGAVTWFVLSIVPITYNSLLVTVTLANVMAMICSTVIGGIIVDTGKQLGATGRLSSMRMIMQTSAALAAGPIGGFIAGYNFRLAPVAGMALMVSLGWATWVNLYEDRVRHRGMEVVRNTAAQVVTILTSWPLLATVGLTFLHYVSPGFDSLLYYHRQNVLGMKDVTIGYVEMVGAAGAVLGALTYGRICRRFNLRTLLYGGMTINAAALLFYYAYRSVPLAFCVEAAAGFVSMLGLLPLYDLSARATPRGSEALGYSLIMAIGNFGIGLSDVWGTRIAKAFGLDFFGMIWINAATTAAILIFIPLLPRVLVSRREGQAA
jgi:predicted MFS family arabinose efflux permease